jgi:hypothetical protein
LGGGIIRNSHVDPLHESLLAQPSPVRVGRTW